jgi:hypothetical protein
MAWHWYGRVFFGQDPKSTRKESKNRQVGLHQTKFCAAKETVNRVKGQPTECEKIFADYSTDKGLISRI